MPDAALQAVDARLAACLLAVDPALGGAVVRPAHEGATRAWIAALHRAQDEAPAPRRLPLSVSDDRLLGGVDLVATLAARRRVVARGLLAEAHRGTVVVPLVECVAAPVVAHLAAALDAGVVVVEREGVAERHDARFVVVAVASPREDDGAVPAALADRLAFVLTLADSEQRADASVPDASALAAARCRLPLVHAPGAAVEALCAVAMALGVASPRAAVLALRAARAHAALAGRTAIDDDDVVLAARLVLAPRATCRPPGPAAPEGPEGPEGPDVAETGDTTSGAAPRAARAELARAPGDREPEVRHAGDAPLTDVATAAACAALPATLLAPGAVRPGRGGTGGGRSGATRAGARRGRQVGVRAGVPSAGRVDVLHTLRAAAPWQALRGASLTPANATGARIHVHRDDVRLRRYRERTSSTTLFVVDASGSAARARLAEAKRAVELLLAESYVRRDRVGLIAFRGRSAELALPPTRALARARRVLAALPAGGGTPLAAGLDLARETARAVARDGGSVVLVVLTDGGANVARDGGGGRSRAAADALDAARRVRETVAAPVVVDCSPRGDPFTAEVAAAMGAAHVRLPRSDAGALRDVARAARAAGGAG